MGKIVKKRPRVPKRHEAGGSSHVHSEDAPATSSSGNAFTTGTTGDEGGVVLYVHADMRDLLELHREVEAAATDVGTNLATFLDATGFWETPRRASELPAALNSVEELPPESRLLRVVVPAHRASDRELRCGGATSARYLRQLRQTCQRARRSDAGWVWLDRDKTTVATAATEDTARRAVGAALEALDWLLAAGTSGRAIVVARPPGHHNGCDERLEARERMAWRFAAHGGCVLNETAVAIRNLQSKHPACRIVVLDLDAHFGDGTAWHFYEEAEVLCVSLHLDQTDLHMFPYLKGKTEERGAGPGSGHTLNLPLPQGAGDSEALQLLEEFAWPAIAAHSPSMVFLSLGLDGLEGDPSGAGLCYTNAFFEVVAARCCSICQRVLCTWQGGYLPVANASALTAVMRVLAGVLPSAPAARRSSARETFNAHLQTIKNVLSDKSTWWSVDRSFNYVPEGFVVDSEPASEDDM